MHHNAHILRTILHFVRIADLYGSTAMPPESIRVYKACYAAMEADVQAREEAISKEKAREVIVDQIATLQFCFPPSLRIQVEQKYPLRWYEDPTTHTILRTPVLVVVWPIIDAYRNNNDTLFTLN